METSDNCFVIMPFKEPLNGYYKKILIPAIKKSNLKAIRADEVYGTMAIIKDIVSQIKKSRLIIADLTWRNPNVAYELGIAHAFGKPVIIIVQDINDVPFDLKHIRIIKYDTTMVKWDMILKDKIIKTISEVLTKPKESIAFEVDNPDVVNDSIRNLLLNTYSNFKGITSSRDYFHFDGLKNCTVEKVRYVVAKSDITHLMMDTYISKKGKIEIIKANDIDKKKDIEIVNYEEYENGRSFFLLFDEVKKKGSSFNYSITFFAQNYLSDLIEKGLDYRRVSPLQKMKFDTINETYYFPNNDLFKDLKVEIENHPNPKMKGKIIDFRIEKEYKIFDIVHDSLSNFYSEIIIKFTL